MKNMPVTSPSLQPSVTLIVETDRVHTSFAIVSSTSTSRTVTRDVQVGGADQAVRQQLTMLAVEAAVTLASETSQTVDLYIHAGQARQELLLLGSRFGPVRVAEHATDDPHIMSYSRLTVALLDDVRLASEAAAQARRVAEMAAAAAGVPAKTSGPPRFRGPRILAATDGGYDKRHGGGTYGWITADGRHGHGMAARTSSSLEAELYAIHQLLQSVAPRTRLHIVVDSQLAIKAIAAAADPGPSYLPGMCQSLVSRIVARSRRVDFVLEWVRGHAGHPLNDGADRLARLARQSAQFGTSSAAVHQISQAIADDALTTSSDADFALAVAA
jgi:ribonuclease HI